MSTRAAIIVMAGIILLSFLIGAYFYPQFPPTVAGHWNARGAADGSIPKFWGLFLMPIVSLALLLLFIVVPMIDPRKENIASFRNYFNGFIVYVMLFLFYVYLLTIFYNLRFNFDFMRFLLPAFAILLYYAGVLTAHAKPNWFIGIRTPWTLESETVWEKTHTLGGKLFKLVAVLALLGLLFPIYAIFMILVPLLAAVAYLFVFSYREYKKENR